MKKNLYFIGVKKYDSLEHLTKLKRLSQSKESVKDSYEKKWEMLKALIALGATPENPIYVR